MKSNFAKKQVTMLTLVLALALAVYLNWRFAGENPLTATEAVSATVGDETSGETGEGDTKYYGDALFVSADSGGSSYFSEARLSRSKTRDEALDTLQKSLQKTDMTEAEKEKLTAELTKIALDITKESNIESLVKAKGFTDCVAFINGAKIKVVVSAPASGLSAAEISQIKEIVVTECKTTSNNISIVEIK